MPVRMKDIAEALGVSIVTVSKALRNHPDIAAETRDRILERVKELNYRPNLMARSLVTGHSELVGLIVSDLVHPFFGEIAKALSAALRPRNFFLVVASTDGDPALEVAEIEHLLAYRLDALVIASCQTTPDNLNRVVAQGTPVILLDRFIPGVHAHYVGADDYKIGVIATEHLIAEGRKRIAHIRGPANSVGAGRAQGYLDTMKAHGFKVPEWYVSVASPDAYPRKHARTEMLKILAHKPLPDGIVCFNDAVALGALDAMQEAGIKVPNEIALIGCGNFHFGDTLRVPLSSVEQGTAAMGKKIAELVSEIVDAKGALKPTKTILAPRLIVRESSKAKSRPSKSAAAAKR